VYVVPNPVDPPPQGPRQRQPLHYPPLIGALGRFDRVKGFDVWITALGRLAEQGIPFRARLAGGGPEAGRLGAQIRTRGLADRVELSEWIAPGDVHAFLSQLDLLCIPARADAFGLTPLEGAAAGVPLVLSRASGHRAMFAENSEALFFDVNDAAGLADRIRRVLDDPGLRERLAAAAFERIRRCYGEAAVVEGIQDAIDNTLLMRDNRQ
jgi:glycosyltransferase involved in cell wall biosynthesis